jgi:hypothetical protein
MYSTQGLLCVASLPERKFKKKIRPRCEHCGAANASKMKWDASTPKLARGNKCARNKEAKKTPKENKDWRTRAALVRTPSALSWIYRRKIPTGVTIK